MQFQPLSWPDDVPRHHGDRLAAKFRYNGRPLTVAESLRRLEQEVSSWTRAGKPWVINPAKVIITSDLGLNKNGIPRSGQREPDDPGVAIYFKRAARRYALPCDRWNRTADNIAAIAHHLEALRGQERWGVGSTEQGLAGYALPPADAEWWRVLEVPATADIHQARAAYRAKATTAHPDAGGSREDWDRLLDAWQAALKDLGLSAHA